MKNLKKVLALAVAFVMCFTMFAGAAVYSDVPAGSDYSEAVTLLSDLGVIAGLPDGSFGVNQTITRADAACLIARMLTGETMPSKYAGASNFTDVRKDAYYESAVAYCAIMGITSGTSTTLGTYSPEREITDGEFIAMITRALGYDTPSNPLSFPMGNVARAQQEGILDNVNVVVDSPALRGEDAQMIYNALFADYDAYAKQQNIYMGADDQVEYTIAHEVFSLDRLAVDTKGDVMYKDDIEDNKNERCVAHTWVVVGVDPREAANTYTAFPIDDKTGELKLQDVDDKDKAITFVYDGDAESIMGYQVELWGDDDHTGTEHDIVAVKTVKGQTAYDWNISMGEDGADELTVADGKEVDAEDARIAVPNTMTKDKGDLKAGIHITDDLTEDAYFAPLFDTTEWKNQDGDAYCLFDWDSDGDIDFVLQTTRKYAEVTDIDSKDISIKSILNGDEIDADLEIDADQLKINCDGVEEEDVIELTYSRAYSAKEKGEVITVETSKVSSDIKNLSKVSTKGKLQMTFDGDVYEYADDDYGWDLVAGEEKLDESDLDGNYELWLDANGYIIKIVESDNNTGYLVALRLEDGEKSLSKGRSTHASMKVKLDDNTVDVYDVAYDLQIVGTVADVDVDGSLSNLDKDRDIQTIIGANTIKKNSADDKQNINKKNAVGTYAFYDKDQYIWTNEERVVGQVYKYWMDSDKVITKLERVAQTVDDYDVYYENTGVVRVGGARNNLYNGRDFNRNVYLKNAKVLFITDYGFVGEETIQHHTHNMTYVSADEDKVLAIDPTTANLRKIDAYNAASAAGNYLARQALTAAGKANGSVAGPTDDWRNDWYGIAGLYAGASIVDGNSTNATTAQIAYDIDDNNYASAAIMTVGNFKEFDKTRTIALITDVDAQNRKDTVFTIEGVMDGQKGPFTTVTADDVSDIFKFWGMPGTSSAWDSQNRNSAPIGGGRDEIGYNSVTDIRNDIDDNGMYAEVTRDADGKVTKVVMMAPAKDIQGGVAGPNKMVIRLAIGNKPEVTDSSVSYAAKETDGTNIMFFKDSDEMYAIDNIRWHTSFKVDGGTRVYKITNAVDKIIGMPNGTPLQTYLGGALFNKEPDIDLGALSDIAPSTTKLASRTDKYAVADVAFELRALVAVGGGIWSDNLGRLDGWTANAVFTYTNGRFDQADAEQKLPDVDIVEIQNGVAANSAGDIQATEITFTGANGTVDRKLALKVGGTTVETTVLGTDDDDAVAAKMKLALEESKVADDFKIDYVGTNGVVLTAKSAKDQVTVSIPEFDIKDDNAAKGMFGTLTATINSTTKGIAADTKAADPVVTLKFTSGANVDLTQRNVLKFRLDWTDAGTGASQIFYVPLLENATANDVATAAAAMINNSPSTNTTWSATVGDDGEVELEYIGATTLPFIWDDEIVVDYDLIP